MLVVTTLKALSDCIAHYYHQSSGHPRRSVNLPLLPSTAYEDVWPLTKANTILNVCPQGERYVVERLGKLLDIKESGWFLGACVCVRARVSNVEMGAPLARVPTALAGCL